MNFPSMSLAYYAILSGCCGATASLFGKLSGLSNLQGTLIIFRAIFFILMLICNGGVFTFYVKALQASSSSLSPTVLSAASNYFLSAVAGFVIFGELVSLLWWTGMILIVLGLVFTSLNESSRKLD